VRCRQGLRHLLKKIVEPLRRLVRNVGRIGTNGEHAAAEPTVDPLSAAREKYARLLDSLFSAASSTDGFETICTLLRVGGLADANWDPFEESRVAFDDYNWILEKAHAERGLTAARRVRLLMYCQAVEMSAPQEILANLLRGITHKGYAIDPFGDLWRAKKKGSFFWIPPSAKQKYNRIRELASAANQSDITAAVDALFDERVRNAFSHSDYIITETQFRFAEGGRAQGIPVERLDQLVDECFAFFGAFLNCHKRWLHHLAKIKRFHRMPQYEVLELLSSEDEGLYGFHMHFSNGSRATYTRRKSGTDATNITFERDGGINFMVGLLTALEPVWKINGEPVTDWNALP